LLQFLQFFLFPFLCICYLNTRIKRMAAITVATAINFISDANNFDDDFIIKPERRVAQKQDKIMDGVFS
jgi:hypothetical protein